MKGLIIINEKNVERIRKELDEGQKRCTARLINPEQVFEAVKLIEEHRLKFGILKKNMEGVSVRVNLYQERYPKAYKYTPEGTVFEIEFIKGKYRLGYVCRDYCDGSSEKRFEFELTDEAKKDVLKYASVF